MTPTLFFLCVGVVALALLAQLFAQHKNGDVRPPSNILIVLAAAATAALGAGALQFSGANGGIRLAAERLVFKHSDDARTDISVGGDPLGDELYVAQVSTGVAAPTAAGLLRVRENDAGDFDVFVRQSARADTDAIVQIGDRIVDAVPLDGRTSVCVHACGSARATWLAYDSGRNALASRDRAGPELERRPGLPGLPSLRGWGPTSRIYPLRHYAPQGSIDDAVRNDLRSFLFRRDRALFIVLLDRAARLRTDGREWRASAETAPVASVCRDGSRCPQRAKARIFAVRFDDAPPDANSKTQGRQSYLSEMRSFDIEASEQGDLRLHLDTPDAITLRQRDLDAEQRAASGSEPWLRIVAGAHPPAQSESQIASVGFDALGGAFRRAIDHRLLFTREQPVVAHGPAEGVVRSGLRVPMGDQTAAIVRIEKLDENWPILGAAKLAILIGALASLWATWGARNASPIAFALFALLDLLLTLRVLIGVQAAYVDSGIDARDAPAQALAAFFAVPLALSLFSRATYERPFRLAAHGVFVAAGLAWIERDVGALGPFVFVGWPIVAAALLGAPAAPVLRWVFERRLAPAEDARATRFATWWWWAATAAVAIARTVLALGGMQEAVPLGGARLSISIVYVPVTILLFAWLFADWAKDARQRPAPLMVRFFAAFGFLCLLPLFAARDTGAIIYALPFAIFGCILALDRHVDDRPARHIWISFAALFAGAAAVAFGVISMAVIPDFKAALPETLVAVAALAVGAVICAQAGLLRARTLLAFPAAIAAVVVIYVNAAPLFPSASEDRIERAVETAEFDDDLSILQDALGYDARRLRIMSLVDRDALADIGTREAEGLSIALAHMADHSREVWGPGFLQGSAPAKVGLLRYHMNDNVTAVHVMGPFGRANAALLVMTLFIGCALAISAARRQVGDAPCDFRYFAGVLGIATVTIVTAYMFLANLGAVPFTGRNAYLLAVNSIGDAAEALGLFAMALFFLRERTP